MRGKVGEKDDTRDKEAMRDVTTLSPSRRVREERVSKSREGERKEENSGLTLRWFKTDKLLSN